MATPGMDIWAMDVARYGDYATLAYTNAKVQEGYRRRVRMTFPNEELPAGRPLLTTPIRDRRPRPNAVWGRRPGWSTPWWFQRPGLEPVEEVTFRCRRVDSVAEEVAAVRERARHDRDPPTTPSPVTGDGAEAWPSSSSPRGCRLPA